MPGALQEFLLSPRHVGCAVRQPMERPCAPYGWSSCPRICGRFPAPNAPPAESAERPTRRWVPWRRRLLGPLLVQIDLWVAVGAAIAAAGQVHRGAPRLVCRVSPAPLHPKAASVAHDGLRQALCGAARRCSGQTGFSQTYYGIPDQYVASHTAWSLMHSLSRPEAVFFRGGGILFPR